MLIRNESPYGIYLNLEEPSDNAGGLSDGQDSKLDADPIDIGDNIDTGEPAEPSYFHSYEDDEGNKTDFKDANELNTYMRQSGLRHADYTRKTQTLAEDRKAYEAEKARQDTDYTSVMEIKKRNDQIEKDLQSLPPEVFARLKEGIKNQPRKQARDPEMDKFMKDYADDKKGRETDKQRQLDNEARERAFTALGKTHEDFNKDEILNMVKSLEEVPQEDQMRTFMEMLYYSQKGKINPAEMELKMAENLEKKAKTPIPMGNTKKIPTTGEKTYSSLKEAKKVALEELT